MTQLDDAHFHLHSANKAKRYEEKKSMKNMNDFLDNLGAKDFEKMIKKIEEKPEETSDPEVNSEDK